jgi:GNAT superfamily N-acetyltransferase
MGIEIRAGRLSDAAPACEVLRRSISECCVEDHLNDAVVLAAWLGNKTSANVESWLASPSHFSLVAVADGELAGIALRSRTGSIVLFYVSPRWRFTGVGKALLRSLESQAVRTGLRALRVASTFTAWRFYERHGYVAAGTVTSVFGRAISMSKQLAAGSYAKRGICNCQSA